MSGKFTLGLLVAGLIVTAPAARVAAAGQPVRQDAGAVARVRAAVAKVGSGLKARVKVRLRDGRKLRGFTSQIGADDFELVSTDDGSVGVGNTVRYEDVSKLEGRGVSTDWLRVAATTAEGARMFLIVLRGVNLRLPPQL